MGDSCNVLNSSYLIVSREIDGSMRKVDLVNSKDQKLKDQISLKMGGSAN